MDRLVVLVTGAAHGQGAEEARAFAAAGAKVAIGDVSDDDGRALAAELGAGARYVHLDVRDEAQWDEALAEIARELGPLTTLVNNAGIMNAAPLPEETPADFRRVIDVNLTGSFLGIRAAARSMRESGGGSIVNISSTAGLQGGRGVPAYTASKWGLRGLTQTAATELAPFGIRVNSVHPGLIDTEMLRAKGRGPSELLEAWRSRLLIPRLGTAQDVAALVLFLASEDASYVTGGEFSVDGGLLATY